MDERVKLVTSLPATLIDGGVGHAGIPIDMQGVHQAKFAFVVGDIVIDTGGLVIILQHSDTSGGVFTTIHVSDLILDEDIYEIQIPVSSSDTFVISTRNRKHKRFIRPEVFDDAGLELYMSVTVALMGLSHTVEQSES